MLWYVGATCRFDKVFQAVSKWFLSARHAACTYGVHIVRALTLASVCQHCAAHQSIMPCFSQSRIVFRLPAFTALPPRRLALGTFG